jgi:hypothetical protein
MVAHGDDLKAQTALDLLNERKKNAKKELSNLSDEELKRIISEESDTKAVDIIGGEIGEKADEQIIALGISRMKHFEQIRAILDKSDFQQIGANNFIKKSGVKKIQNAMRFSVRIMDIKIIEKEWVNAGMTGSPKTPGKEIIVIVTARASRPRLRLSDNMGHTLESLEEFVEETASCSNKELAENKHQSYSFHNILSTASTRATNRAIMNLAKGDVSVEEL